jgi:hypothetical protein
MEIFLVVLNSLSLFLYILTLPKLAVNARSALENEKTLENKSRGSLAGGYFLVSLFYILKYFGIDFFTQFFGWILIFEFCWVAFNLYLNNNLNTKTSFPVFLRVNLLNGCVYYLIRFIGFSTLIYQLIVYFKS